MRRYGLVSAAVAAVAAVLLGHQVALWLGLSSSEMRSSDYTPTYVAAKAWRSGDGAGIYDPAVQLAGHRAIGTPKSTEALPFANPPLAAVVAAPFSLLGFLTSYRLFGLVQVLLVAAAIGIAVRAGPWPRSVPRFTKLALGLAALAGTGTEVLLLQAQWDGVAALGLAIAYAAWRSRRPGWAGVAIALSFGITKPHLVFGLVAFLIARGERRATIAAAVTTIGMVVGSLLLVGPHGTLAFVTALGQSSGITPPATVLGLNGLVFSNLQGGAIAVALSVAGGAAAVAVCAVLGAVSRRRPERLEVALAGATMLSLLAAPHLLVHDLVVLAPALVWCGARLAVATWPARDTARAGLGLLVAWLALCMAAIVDAGNGSVGAPGRLVPWVLLAGSVVAAVASTRGRVRLRRLEPVVAAG